MFTIRISWWPIIFLKKLSSWETLLWQYSPTDHRVWHTFCSKLRNSKRHENKEESTDKDQGPRLHIPWAGMVTAALSDTEAEVWREQRRWEKQEVNPWMTPGVKEPARWTANYFRESFVSVTYWDSGKQGIQSEG